MPDTISSDQHLNSAQLDKLRGIIIAMLEHFEGKFHLSKSELHEAQKKYFYVDTNLRNGSVTIKTGG